MSDIIKQSEAGVALTAEELAVQEILAQDTAQAMSVIDLKLAKIGVIHRDKKFKTVDDRLVNSISGIIVHAQKTRGFWENEGDKIPRCSSLNGLKGRWNEGDLSSPGGTTPQERSCANCPLNVYGSAEKGAGKACKEMRRLFVVESGDELPSILNVPPTSLKSYDDYVTKLITKKLSTIALLTTMRLEGAQGVGFDYSKINFERGELLPAREIIALDKMRKRVVEAASRMEIEAEDYIPEGNVVDGATTSESEPY